jgi:hypothetical protein
LRVVVREDVALHFRELEAAFVRSGLPGSFLEFLAVSFWWIHAARFRFGTSAKPVFDRDRHQCTCPVCEARTSLTNHHLVYRAHGGGDELSNQITACAFHHLFGEHAGRLKVRGTADRLTWWLGRQPILKVTHRTKVELTAP